MPIEHRFQYDQQIKDNERGIYFCDIDVSYQEKSVTVKDVVFAMSGQDRTIRNILKEGYLKSINFKEMKNQKQVIHFKIKVKVFLSNVHQNVYDQWKTS